MTNNRKFYELISNTISFIAVELSDEDKFGVVALEKQLAKYIDISGMNIVYWFPMVNKVQRDALVERKIPFIWSAEVSETEGEEVGKESGE
ncbi:MAG: hypothetical protein Q4A40_04780 [Bacillota bacterium]|nr:hypothetical protein [Bacillota bacterium]